MLKATKVRLYPSDEQAVFLNAQFGAVRFVYNKALHIKTHFYRRHGRSLHLINQIKPLLTVAKRSRKYPWLKHYDSIALQQSVIHLHNAFARFFDPKLNARYPRFKSKQGRQSSYHCSGIKVLDGAIKLPKLSPIKATIHRTIAGQLKSITLSRSTTGKYYASILIDDGIKAPSAPALITTVSGIDLGLSHYAIQSDATKTDNPRFIIRTQNNLRRKQRQLSRKHKGSRNRAKARLQVAKCHEKTANARADFQHKLSRSIIDDNQAVIVETLKSANMMKNRRLAKHIADAAWHGFVKKLEYKAKAQGKPLVKLDQWYASSKTCHQCGHRLSTLPLQVRAWQCPNCHSHHDRDINAALNIQRQGIVQLKAAGHVVTACGGLRKTGYQPVAACEARSLA